MRSQNLLGCSVVLAFGLWLASGSAPAQVQNGTPTGATAVASPVASPASGELPDTPVGRQLAWVLSALVEEGTSLTEADVVARLTPDFLAVVPAAQFVATTRELVAVYGPFTFGGFAQPPSETDAVATVIGRAGDAFTLTISVEPAPPHRIVGLLLAPGAPSAGTPVPVASWDEVDQRLRALAPHVNLLAAEITDGACRPVHAVNAGQPLALGSAFKLYVLGELAHQVEQGTASWDEELAIRDELKSLPGGRMQDEPAGTTHSLRVFAEQMISISDNTATDHLIVRLGRENVEAFQTAMGHADPARNVPFLTTRELFALKLKRTPERIDSYLTAPIAEQRRILDEEIGPLPLSLADVGGWLAPRRIDTLEWFASAEDLCRAMTALKTMAERPGIEPVRDILSINPGIPFDTSTWTYIGFKGGSEPGVLNVTWLLQRADGRWFVLTAGFNDPDRPLDETAAIELLSTVAPLLATTP